LASRQLEEDDETISETQGPTSTVIATPTTSTVVVTPSFNGTAPSRKEDPAVLAGGIVGGLFVLGLITCTIIVVYLRRKKSSVPSGHRPIFKAFPPSVYIQPDIQIPLTAPHEGHTSAGISEARMNHIISEQPPNYQHIVGRWLPSLMQTTSPPVTGIFSSTDQIHQEQTGAHRESWRLPPPVNITVAYPYLDDQNLVSTVYQMEDKATPHRVLDADEVQETRSRHTTVTMTETLPPSYHRGSFDQLPQFT
jgi:hypothetical protein